MAMEPLTLGFITPRSGVRVSPPATNISLYFNKLHALFNWRPVLSCRDFAEIEKLLPKIRGPSFVGDHWNQQLKVAWGETMGANSHTLWPKEA